MKEHRPVKTEDRADKKDMPHAKQTFVLNIVRPDSTKRIPVIMLDVEIHNMTVLEVKELPHDTGWGTVPTPLF